MPSHSVVSESWRIPKNKKIKNVTATSHLWTFLAAAMRAHRKRVKRTQQLFLCFSASVTTAPDAACLHIAHRWQRWPLGWRQSKPELFIFCKRGGKKKNLTSAKKSFRKVGASRKHLPESLQSAAEFDWQAPSDMWQLGLHATAEVKRENLRWPSSKKRPKTTQRAKRFRCLKLILWGWNLILPGKVNLSSYGA